MHIKTTLAAAAFLAAQGAIAQEQIVKLGITGPLSGSNAFAGKDNENGVRLAVEELNAKKLVVAGKTLKFEILSEDDAGDPKTGVSVAQKLVDKGVKFVLGPYNSGVAIPASKVYNDAGMVMSTVGTNAKITQAGYKLVFRIAASDDQVGAAMAKYAAQSMKVKNIGVIDDRTSFGQGLAAEFIKEAKRSGAGIAGHEFTTDKATDFSSILTSLKAKKVDAIFFAGYAPQAGPMMRQMKQLGITAKLLGGDTLCTPEMGKLAGDAANDMLLCAQAGAALDKLASGPEFAKKYQARFKQKPDVYAPAFYDQTMFLAQAMKATNSLDPSVVAKALHSSEYKGVVTNYSYDDAGNMKQSQVTVYTFRNGEPVPVAK